MAREVQLTKSGYQRLIEELKLERERLEQKTLILQELMESSDDFEDSSMEDTKRELGLAEIRISELEDNISRAVIIEVDGHAVKEITLGAVVHLKASDAEMDVQLVLPLEASVLERPIKISDESPMGRALMGKKLGSKVILETPKGKKEYKIETIKH